MVELHKFNVRRVFIGAPLLAPVGAFCFGVFADRSFAPSGSLIAAWIGISLLGLAWFRAQRWARLILLCGLACGAGALHHAKAARFLPANHISRYAAAIDPARRVELLGRVLSAPVTHFAEKAYPYHVRPYIFTYFTVTAEQLKVAGRLVETCGLVRIVLPGIHDQYRPGAKLIVEGRLAPERQYTRWPGVLTRPGRASLEPNRVRMKVSPMDPITIVDYQVGVVRNALARLRRSAQALLVPDGSASSPQARGLISAMILGQRYKVEQDVNRAFLAVGASHFLAVSGFHLGVVATAGWLIGLGLGLSRKSAAWLVLLVIWLYVGINEIRPPIVRSAIMTTFGCLAILTRRPINSINWLAAAALVILMINPCQLFSVGFQLSFLCVCGIILLHRPIRLRLFGQGVSASYPSTAGASRFRLVYYQLRKMAKFGFTISIAAWAAALPIVMLNFGQISPIGPIAAVLMYPFTTIVIGLGFCQLLLAAVVGNSFFLPSLVDGFSLLLMWIVKLMGGIPGSSFSVMPPPVIIVIGYYGVLIWLALSDDPDPAEVHLAGPGLASHLRRLAAPSLKKNVFFGLIAAYLTYWIVSADAIPGRSTHKPEIVVANRARGQTVTVRVGANLLIIDGGAGSPRDVADLVGDLRIKYMARPKVVVLTFPEQRFFNDLPELARSWPEAAIYATSGFLVLRADYTPIDELFSANIVSDRSILYPGQAIEGNGFKLSLLYPSDRVAAAALRLRRPPAKMRGIEMLRRFRELGGVVLVETSAVDIVVSSVLSPIACEIISDAYPDLRADVLVVYAKSPVGMPLERFVDRLDVTQLIVCGRASQTHRRWYDQLCKRLSVNLTFVTGRCRVISLTHSGQYQLTN